MSEESRCLFQPIRINSCTIRNRYAMAPMGTFGMVDETGIMSDACVDYYIRRAEGGVGLIITGMCIVEDRYEENFPNMTPLFSAGVDHKILRRRMLRLTEQVHKYGTKIFLQLSAGFGRVAHIGTFCGKAVAPSEMKNRFNPDIIHRALTVEEIHTYIEAFGRESAFAKEVGFDGVEIHALHEGYLLDQFATECFNHRTDEYGGSFENRYRFAIEILQEIRKTCGTDFPVSMRYSPKHCMKAEGEGALPGEVYREYGRDMPEGIRAAKYLEKAGYDALDVDLGCYDAHFWSHPPVYFSDGLYLDAAREMKKAVSIPIIVSGRMDDPVLGERAICEGSCDMTALGRPLLADPELPKKIEGDHPEQVRPCISCNFGCSVRIRTEGTIGCTVNPECAHEDDRILKPAANKKKIMVIGGGPGGMEFARAAALRGHSVQLFERENELGGQLIPASMAPFKHHDRGLINWYVQELQKLPVEIHLSTEVSEELIRANAPDCVVFANGAVQRRMQPEGSERKILSVTEISEKINEAGQNVVIIGAGQTGVETGIWLAQLGRNVTILNRSANVMKGAYHNTAAMARLLMKKHGVRLITEMQIESVDDESVVIRTKDGKKEKLPADTVIASVGAVSENELYLKMKDELKETVLLGDAKSVRNIYFAIHEAYVAAASV